MLESNFFYKFFRNKKNTSDKITKFVPSKNFEIENNIKQQLMEIDREITQNSKSLFEAQIVKFRSAFSNPNNFIEKIGKNVYKVQIEDSINWHQKQLKNLYFERSKIQIQLEKITGRFWINRIKRIMKIILLGLGLLLSISIFISGFLAIIYLLPFFIFIFICYILFKESY